MTRTERLHSARRGRRVHGLAVLGVSVVIALVALLASCTGSVPTTAPYVAPAASTRAVEASGVGGALDVAQQSSTGVGGALAAAPAASGQQDVSVTSADPAPASATTTVGRFVVGTVGLNVNLSTQPY